MFVLAFFACVPASTMERAAAVVEGLTSLTRAVARAEGVEVRGIFDLPYEGTPRGTWSATRTVLEEEDAACENGEGEPYACTRIHLTASAALDAEVTGDQWRHADASGTDWAWRETPVIPARPVDTIFEAPEGRYEEAIALRLEATAEITSDNGLQSAWEGEVALDDGEAMPFAGWLRLEDTGDVYRVTLDDETREWDQQYGSR